MPEKFYVSLTAAQYTSLTGPEYARLRCRPPSGLWIVSALAAVPVTAASARAIPVTAATSALVAVAP
ncbi:MAG: hypothetical protein JWO31_2012, partial [Phycisphaerales bacterium]|nr:hypothetical protein [Phycisphaerales bacterium]